MKRHFLAAATLLTLATSHGALAADPNGVWLTQTGTSRIRVADCGGALCGTIVWLQEPNDAETKKPKTDKNNSDAAKRAGLREYGCAATRAREGSCLPSLRPR